jgi:uncharacterized protein (DUF58 family)
MFRYRIGYCAVLAAAILFYLFSSGYLSFFTMVFLFLLPLVSWLFTLLAVFKTTVSTEMKSPIANKNEEFILNVIVKNTSIFPIARAQLKLCCVNSLCGVKQRQTLFLPVNARAEQLVEHRIQSQYCGKITVELSQIKYYDYLGIFTIKKKLGVCTEAFVLPQIQFIDARIDTATNVSMESSTYSKVKPGDNPSEIFDIRPFRDGDRMRNIHWKLSSKLDEWMVKEFSQPTDSTVLLLTELLAPNMQMLDTLVDVLATLSHFLTENQMNHRIAWFDQKNAQFNEETIESEDDFGLLMNTVLSAGGYRDKPFALTCRNKLGNFTHDYPHAIYLTGRLTAALTDFCDRPNGEKTTVLYICEKTDSEQESLGLNTLNAQVVKIRPEKIQECLSGVIL